LNKAISMRTDRLRCAIVLIDDDDRSVQLLARLTREDSYAVALTVSAAAVARRRNARMLARLLRADGWHVDLTFGDWAGMELLTRRPHPEALIVDVDGRRDAASALVRHARALLPSMAIALLSDRPRQLTARIAGLSPAPVVLDKPIEYAALKAVLLSEVRPRTTSEIVPINPQAANQPRVGQNRR
jgi:DNA-binding response OmpR family regulator